MAPTVSQRMQDFLRSVTHVLIFVVRRRVLPFIRTILAVLAGMLSNAAYFALQLERSAFAT